MKITFATSARVLYEIERGSTDPKVLKYREHYMPEAHVERLTEIRAAEAEAVHEAAHD